MTPTRMIRECNLCKRLSHRVLAPAGNTSAHIAFLVPAPSDEDLERGHLLMGYAGNMVRRCLRSYADLDLADGKAFALPITFCAGKMTQVQARNCRPFVDYWLKKADVGLCVIWGSTVFQGFFHDGSMPELLAGTSRKELGYPWDFFFMSDFSKLKEIDDYKDELTQRFLERRLIQECRALGKFVAERRVALCGR